MTQKPNFDEFGGRRVLITGASLGIGAAVAKAFGACGSLVGVHYNRSAEAAKEVAADIDASGGKAVLLQADLGDPNSYEPFVADVLKQMGGVDVLINNAGAMIARRPFEDVDDAFYMKLFDINVRQIVGITNRLVGPLSEAPGGGVIINTTSVAVKTGGAQGSMIYAATKGALHSMSIGMSKELAAKKIRVNCVAPSLIATPFHDGITGPETLEKVRAQVPLGRLGEAEDCVGAYLYLASNGLAGYVSGAVIEITGAR